MSSSEGSPPDVSREAAGSVAPPLDGDAHRPATSSCQCSPFVAAPGPGYGCRRPMTMTIGVVAAGDHHPSLGTVCTRCAASILRHELRKPGAHDIQTGIKARKQAFSVRKIRRYERDRRMIRTTQHVVRGGKVSHFSCSAHGSGSTVHLSRVSYLMVGPEPCAKRGKCESFSPCHILRGFCYG